MSTRLPDRSERQLMGHAADRLSVRWYVGYDLNEPLPDHSSLTRIRERYGVDVFRRFFDANVDLDSLTPRFAIEARAVMQAPPAALFAEHALHDALGLAFAYAELPWQT